MLQPCTSSSFVSNANWKYYVPTFKKTQRNWEELELLCTFAYYSSRKSTYQWRIFEGNCRFLASVLAVGSGNKLPRTIETRKCTKMRLLVVNINRISKLTSRLLLSALDVVERRARQAEYWFTSWRPVFTQQTESKQGHFWTAAVGLKSSPCPTTIALVRNPHTSSKDGRLPIPPYRLQ